MFEIVFPVLTLIVGVAIGYTLTRRGREEQQQPDLAVSKRDQETNDIVIMEDKDNE